MARISYNDSVAEAMFSGSDTSKRHILKEHEKDMEKNLRTTDEPELFENYEERFKKLSAREQNI